jgi:hypothetical protein
VLIVCQINTGSSSNSFAYSAAHRRAPRPAGDWLLVYDRDACRRPFNGFQDEFDIRDGEDHPVAQALRGLGGTVVVEEVLPADLSNCAGIFVVGGFDENGVNIDDEDLGRLTAYMDNGGDMYVEGSRLGEFMDPSLGAGNAAQQAFWLRFSCTFTPGVQIGNLNGWNTFGNAFLGLHQFSYDTGKPDEYVGELTPNGNAGFLARDTGGKVRATAVRAHSGASTRVMSTLVLGGSTGVGGATRDAFLGDVLTLFGTNVAALAVARATVSVHDRDVTIDGVLEHYDERALSLVRADADGLHDVLLTIEQTGGEWRFRARDRLATESAVYRLLDTENDGRVLWEERVSERTPDYRLRLAGIYPNPARDMVRLAVDAPSDAGATLSVYDVAGRLVSREPATLRRGSNTLFIRSLPAASGVYFVHISAPAGSVRGRLLVIR